MTVPSPVSTPVEQWDPVDDPTAGSRSRFIRGCFVVSGVLVVLGIVGIARWSLLPLAGFLLCLAALTWLIGLEEGESSSDVEDEVHDVALDGPVVEGPGLTTVRLCLPTAVGCRHATVAGDFNGWSTTANPMRREGDAFVADLRLAPGRSYRYRYLLDGERWENDWSADAYVPNAFGSDDSVIDLTADSR